MKYNVFEKQNDYERTLGQMVYLKNICNWTYKEIAKLTGYAVSTIRTYCYKFASLLEKAKEWFEEKKRSIIKEKNIIFEQVQEIQKKPCAYIVEYYSGNKREFLKIGKTEQTIKARIKQHFDYYNKKGYNLDKCIVKHLFYVEDNDQVEIVESTLRKHYKSQDLKGFIKLDRFKNAIYEEVDIIKNVIPKYELILNNL